jgi:hypothetical protein
MSGLAGFLPLYERRVALAAKRPIALASQALTPVLWVLVVGPALARAVGGFARGVDYFTYVRSARSCSCSRSRRCSPGSW